MANLVLHPGQSAVYKDLFIDRQHRYIAVAASRGWGKSYFAGCAASTAVFELLQLRARVPHKNVVIIAPTYSQVTDIYYPLLAYEIGLSKYAVRESQADGRFVFPNNVELKLMSYEAAERLRGTGNYLIIMDEVRDWTSGIGLKKMWQEVLQPSINTRWSPMRAQYFGAPSPGRAMAISTTKGYDDFYDMYNYHERDSLWGSYHFDYTTSPYLDPDDIERIKHTVDPLTFKREYLAQFEDSGNSVFYCFDRKVHVRRDLPPLQDGETVHIGIDFNVGLQCSSMFTIRGNQVHYLEEFKGHPDTEQLAVAIKGRYWPNYHNVGHPDFGKKTRQICVYPDPTGNSRKTSAPVGTTDLSILASHGFNVLTESSSPSIVDSVACVNRKLKTAANDIDMYFSPEVIGLIESMERTTWVENNPNTATIDKKKGVEHFSDSVRYPMSYLFKINAGTSTAKRSFRF